MLLLFVVILLLFSMLLLFGSVFSVPSTASFAFPSAVRWAECVWRRLLFLFDVEELGGCGNKIILDTHKNVDKFHLLQFLLRMSNHTL